MSTPSLSCQSWGEISLGDHAVRLNAHDQHALLQIPFSRVLSCTQSKTDVTFQLGSATSESATSPESPTPSDAPRFEAQPHEIRLSIPPKPLGLDPDDKDGAKTLTQLVQGHLLTHTLPLPPPDTVEGSNVAPDDPSPLPPVLATLPDLTCAAPSAVFSMTLTPTLLQLRESKKNQTYGIPIHTLQCMFLLPHPLGGRKYFILALSSPIRIGASAHKLLVFVFDEEEVCGEGEGGEAQGSQPKTSTTAQKVNLTPSQIQQHFPASAGMLAPVMSGPRNEVVAKLLKGLTQKKILGQSLFRPRAAGGSASHCPAVRAVHKGQTGFVYLLDKSLLFLHRPAVYVRYEEIKEGKVEGLGGVALNRTFSVTLVTNRGEKLMFGAIDKAEGSGVMAWMKARGVGLITDEEGEEETDSEEEEETEDSDVSSGDFANSSESESEGSEGSSDSESEAERKERKRKRKEISKKEKSDRKNHKKEKRKHKDKKHRKDKHRDKDKHKKKHRKHKE